MVFDKDFTHYATAYSFFSLISDFIHFSGFISDYVHLFRFM